MSKTSPDSIIDKSDPGDEIIKRFRYQATYAAIVSLSMLREEPLAKEIYCEHHEDILVKLPCDRFIGIQVKTRNLSLGPFDCFDDEIVKSIKKFVTHELGYGDNFKRYVIATNNGFSVKNNSRDLNGFIDLAKKGDEESLLKARSNSKKLIEKISKECSCNKNDVINVLKKLSLKGNLSSMDDISLSLVRQLSEVENLKSQTMGKLTAISQELIMIHLNASSLEYKSSLYNYYILSSDPKEKEEKDIINGKKITKVCIKKIIDKLIEEPITLLIENASSIDIPKGSKKLEKKMDAGGIDFNNIDLFKNNKYSFENHVSTWLYKYDSHEAIKKFNQVKLIIANECQAAHDNTEKEDVLFGKEMLREVRERIQKRLGSDKDSFFDCKYEHLLGLAGVLTEDCKIWWSLKFDVES